MGKKHDALATIKLAADNKKKLEKIQQRWAEGKTQGCRYPVEASLATVANAVLRWALMQGE